MSYYGEKALGEKLMGAGELDSAYLPPATAYPSVGTNAVERDTVGAALDRQYEGLLILHGLINQLEERLQTALEPTKGEGIDGSGSAPESKQLLHRVCRATNVVDAAAGRIERLTARLLV